MNTATDIPMFIPTENSTAYRTDISTQTIAINTTSMPQQHYPLVYITGSISINESYKEEIVSQWNDFQNKSEHEIKKLLDLDDHIIGSLVSVKKLRDDEIVNAQDRLIVEFTAVCSLSVSENFILNEIQVSIDSSITHADHNLFEYFDKESFLSYNFDFEEPKILKIESISKDELTDFIGKLI